MPTDPWTIINNAIQGHPLAQLGAAELQLMQSPLYKEAILGGAFAGSGVLVTSANPAILGTAGSLLKTSATKNTAISLLRTLPKIGPFVASALLVGGIRGVGATAANAYLAGATGGGGEVSAFTHTSRSLSSYIQGGATSSPSNQPRGSSISSRHHIKRRSHAHTRIKRIRKTKRKR